MNKETIKSKAITIRKILNSIVQQNSKYKDNEGIIYLKLLGNILSEEVVDDGKRNLET